MSAGAYTCMLLKRASSLRNRAIASEFRMKIKPHAQMALPSSMKLKLQVSAPCLITLLLWCCVAAAGPQTDVDVSPDGNMLIFVDSEFKPGSGPQYANLVISTLEGAQFVRSPESSQLLRLVNKPTALQYAPTISSNKLTLYFTRFDRDSDPKGPQIYRATRSGLEAPFRPPAHVPGLGEYVEGRH